MDTYYYELLCDLLCTSKKEDVEVSELKQKIEEMHEQATNEFGFTVIPKN